MAVLRNAKKEKFVQGIVSGMSQRKAYLAAYPSAEKWKKETVDKRASELFQDGEVLGRYRELLEEAKDDAIMIRKDRMVALSNIAKSGEEKTENRIKAIDTLNKMDGQYVNRVEVSGSVEAEKTKLDDLISQMRGDSG